MMSAQDQMMMSNTRRFIRLRRTLMACLLVLAGVGASLMHSGCGGASEAAASEIAMVARSTPSPTLIGQSVTQLPDGSWLLIGGESVSGPVSTIWRMQGEATTQLPITLEVARRGHSAAVLPDGTVMVFGGLDALGEALSSAEIIDPVRLVVSELPTTGLTVRSEHSATLLTNGELLIAGGRDGLGNALSSAELWNAHTGVRVAVGSEMQIARYAQEAALLATGEGLIWGGHDASGAALANGELYDPSSNLFEGVVSAQDARIAGSVLAGQQPPILADSEPHTDAQGVPLDILIGLRFSKALPIASVNAAAITLVGPNGAVAGSVSGAERGMLAFFTPTQELLPGTTYTLFISGLKDEEGVALSTTGVRFTTLSVVASQNSATTATVVAAVEGAQPPSSSAANVAVVVPVNASSAIKTSPPKAAPPKLPQTPQNNAASETAEDWVPAIENRHGTWRVLGLKNDPPLASPSLVAALAAPARQTAVTGRVLRLNGLPLQGVAVGIGSTQAVTDAQGQFLLTGVPPGDQLLRVDGRSVTRGDRHYTEHFIRTSVTAGSTNAMARPIYLPRVDPATEVAISSPADHEIVLTNPAMPGLEVHVPKGAVIREQGGKIVRKLSLTPIPVDRAPYPSPVPFSVYFTLQPGGAYVDGDPSKAIKIVYPNYQGLAPTSKVNFWNYDAAGDGWQIYGHGTVSPDGSRIIADESVGFRQIMTFGFGVDQRNGAPPPTAPTPNGLCVGDPVDCATGIFSQSVTDLTVNDVVPISVTREYRTNDNQPHLFGVGANLAYAMYLYSPDSPTGPISLVRGDGSQIVFANIANDQWQNTNSPTVFNGATISLNETLAVFEMRLRNGTLLRFVGPQGPNQLQAIIDPNGNTVSIESNTATGLNNVPLITRVLSPNGRYIQFFYDAQQRITQAIDNAGRSVSYSYDSAGHLSSATDADGNVERYGFDPTTNNMNLVTDRRGNASAQNVFDSNGRITQQTMADGAVWHFSYTANADGVITQTKITDPRGYVNQVTLNASGYPTQNVLAQGQPEQQTYTTQYDVSNLPLSVTDTLGRQTLYGYDEFGDLTSLTALAGTPNAVTYLMTYDPTYHQLTGITDPLGHVTTRAIGNGGTVAAITDALSHQTSMTYNPAGQRISLTDPLGNTTSIAYTGPDLASIADPLTRQVQFAEDAVGRPASVTDPLGNTTQYTLDAMNRLTGLTNAMGGATSFTFDQNGNLLTSVDPNHVTQTYTYDSRNRRHTYVDPLGHTATYNHDSIGNLTSFVDRKGQTTSVVYDGINRPILITYADSSTVSITWDAGNRATSFVDSANGTITRQFDGLNRLTQESSPQGTVNYGYDAAGRRASMSVAGQTQVNYTFDNANRLTQIAQGALSVGYGYDNANRRTSITYPNDVSGSFAFDNASELTGITYANGATQIGTLIYGYDADGRRTSLTGTLAALNAPTTSPSLIYNGANQLTTTNGTALSYDANGNLTVFGGTSYTWNARNQLTAVSAGTASMSYDALGRRISATIGGSATNYLYDGANPVTAGGNFLLGTLGLDDLQATVTSGTATSFLRDGINSTVALSNSSGTSAETYSYSAYGETAASGSGGTSFQYTGRENDGATGLYYYRARYYSPQLGRFISEDPMGLRAGTNFYAYVSGDPVNLIDPLGLCDTYFDRYADFVSQYAINVGPAATLLAGGVMPKSWAPYGNFRPPLLGSTNPLTSVIRGITGYTSPAVEVTAATIGVATVAVGIYDATIEIEGLIYAF